MSKSLKLCLPLKKFKFKVKKYSRFPPKILGHIIIRQELKTVIYNSKRIPSFSKHECKHAVKVSLFIPERYCVLVRTLLTVCMNVSWPFLPFLFEDGIKTLMQTARNKGSRQFHVHASKTKESRWSSWVLAFGRTYGSTSKRSSCKILLTAQTCQDILILGWYKSNETFFHFFFYFCYKRL